MADMIPRQPYNLPTTLHELPTQHKPYITTFHSDISFMCYNHLQILMAHVSVDRYPCWLDG